MGRNVRVQVSLTPEIADRLDEVPQGERSAEARQALREYWGMEGEE